MNRSLLTRVREELRDRERRTMTAAAAGFLFDLAYGLYHGALGLMDRSVWLMTLCAYYGVLAVMRFAAILYGWRRGEEERSLVNPLFGGLLILLSLVLAGINYLSLANDTAVRHGTIIMITIAAYTFTKITMAAVRAVGARRDSSQLLSVVRRIGYAEVAVSVYTMQRSMIVSFEGASDRGLFLMNIATGSVVWLFVFFLGLSMIFKWK